MKKIAYFSIIPLGIVIDQLTKLWATQSIELYEKIEVIPGLFYFTSTRNTGGAWSIFSGNMMFFYLLTIAALVAMVIYFKKATGEPYIRLAILCVMTGTVGNFIDRLYFQYVRDFIGVYLGNYAFPVFNVADMFISLGVMLYIVVTLYEEYNTRKKVNNG